MRKFVETDGKRYAWRDILKLRKEQRDELRAKQFTLFELKDDARPTSQLCKNKRASIVLFLQRKAFSIFDFKSFASAGFATRAQYNP
jgi:hypothetical protein